MAQGDVGIYASQISGHLWAPNGAMDALATITVPSGGVSSVTFAGIPQGYKHLQLRWMAKGTNSGSVTGINFRINGDTGSNYRRHYLATDGSGSNYSDTGADTFLGWIPLADATSVYGFGVTDVLNYTSTTSNKTIKTLTGEDKNTGGGHVGIFSHLYFATPAAVTWFTFYPDSGNFSQHSQFALYGVK